MSRESWADATVPADAEWSTIPIPDDADVRAVANRARSLSGDDPRVTVETHGLVPVRPSLEALLFNANPDRPTIHDGTIRFTVSKELHVEGHGEGLYWVDVTADADTLNVESVTLGAALL